MEIKINTPPTVEIDTEAPAAYIRLRKGAVARTVITREGEIMASVDFDNADQPLGIEVLWPEKFNIQYLLAVSLSGALINQDAVAGTVYVRTVSKDAKTVR
jgi:uncharacterized protein YuzE